MTSQENQPEKNVSDLQILIQNHQQQFVRDEQEDKKINIHSLTQEQYGQLLAKQYYDKLYKEYALIDLSKYQTGKFGLRWRTKDEVLHGKGDSICGNIDCSEKKLLQEYEVNFAYVERDEKKNILVKVCVCQDCSLKLNFKIKHKVVESKYKRKKREERQKRREMKVIRKAKNMYKDELIYLNQKYEQYQMQQKQKQERQEKQEKREREKDQQVDYKNNKHNSNNNKNEKEEYVSKYEQKYIQKKVQEKQLENMNAQILMKTN